MKEDREAPTPASAAGSTEGLRTVETLQALAEPNRMRIVEFLRGGPQTVGKIAERLGLKQPQTSKHLKVLSDSGIVEMRAEANRRIYSLKDEPFRDIGAWLDPFLRTMAERFDNLDDYLTRLQRDQAEVDEEG